MIFRNMKKNLLFTFTLISGLSFSQTVVLSEDFQSGIPSTWEVRNLDGKTPDASVSEYTAAYISKMDPADSMNFTASSTSYFAPVGVANRWLITPPIVLGAYGNAIEWKAKSHDASYPETYLVLASSTDTLTASFTDTIGYVVQEFNDWTVRTADLSELGLDNQTIYVAFILQTNDGFKFYLDDIEFTKNDPAGILENEIAGLSLKTIESGLYVIDSKLSFDNIQVYDAMGKIVLETTNKTIDLRAENSGLYFIQARRGNLVFNNKISK